MNIINGFCSVVERFRSVMFDAGTQGMGLDANNDEIPPPDEVFNLSQVIPTIRATADVARAFLEGDLVAMYAHFNANEGLPPLATLEYPHQGELVRTLRHLSGATTQLFSGVHEIQTRILSFLEPRDVAKATSDLPSGWGTYQIDDLLLYVRLPVTDSRFREIGEKVWRECFGDPALQAQKVSFGETPYLQSLNAIRGFVESLDQFAAIPVEGDVGSTLMTLPDGLTLNNLIALAAVPQAGHQPAVINYIYGPIAAQYGNLPVKGGLVAISNGVLLGSRNKSPAEQSALVAGHGCQMPRLVDAVALCFLTYINSSTTATGPERLLNDAPWTYTRCIDQIAVNGNSYNLVVGGFAPAGLRVHGDSLEGDGVCVLRKF